MISAVDTNVLLDVFRPDPQHGPQSAAWLQRAYDDGAVLVCDVVYAELVPFFGDRLTLDRALREVNATLSPIDSSIAYEAGMRWDALPPIRGTEDANCGRFSDRRSCAGCRRYLPDAGSRLLRDVLSGSEDSRSVVSAGGSVAGGGAGAF